jgi:hypothetical protein
MSKQKIKNSQDGDTEEKERESIGTKLLDELKNWDEDFTAWF